MDRPQAFGVVICDNQVYSRPSPPLGNDHPEASDSWVSRKSSKARRAIMPRLALSPVCTSSRSRSRSRRANRATGKRTLTIVDGSPFGRPLGFVGVLVGASRFRPSAWRRTVAMRGSSTDLNVELGTYNILQKILL